MYKCNRPRCNNKVKQNVFFCKKHIKDIACNYISLRGEKCQENVYDKVYCFTHCYMELKYIVLQNKKISIEHPLCDNKITINTYISYDRNKMVCHYFTTHFPICDDKKYSKAIHYYTYIYRRWVTMYLVMQYYLRELAYDIFSNVASNYIFL
jgi:hypothetical protein